MSTLKDIANQAGVSVSSVSRVLNQDDSFSISGETKLKILQAAQDLQYKSNHIVLGDGRAGMPIKIAMIMLYTEMLEVSDSYYLTIRVNAKEEALRLGYKVEELFLSREYDTKPELSDFSGILVVGDTIDWYSHPQLRKTIMDSHLPVIFVDFDPHDTELQADCIINDFRSIVEKAIACFSSLGFTHIGYAGTQGYQFHGAVHDDLRYKTFEEILKAQGCFHPEYVYKEPHSFAENGYIIGKQLVASHNLPQAFFVENDSIAIGLMRALREDGIRVPDALSIIACNDIPTARFLSPPLTSVQLHSDLIGILAVRSLADRVRYGRELGITVMVPNELILRQSCKQLPPLADK